MNTTFTTYAEKKAKQFLNLLQGYTKGIRITAILILLLMGVSNAWSAELKNGQYIYIKYGTGNWGAADAKFRFNWYWNVGDWCCYSNEEGRISNDNGSYYAYAKTQNEYTRAVQILRFNSDFSSEWNYTKTVAVSSNTKNCITLTSNVSDDYTFSWSTYAPPMSTVTLADNGTSTVGGTGASSDPYLIYTATSIKVKASGSKTVNDPDATIYYDFKQGTTSQQNGTGTTYSFTASSTPNTAYTINLDGYTKISTTSSTKKTATALYFKTIDKTYTVTLNQQSGTGGTTSVTATYGAAMPKITIPTRTGYTFNGYYDAASGGTQYYKVDGSSARTWNKTAATTLYAQWTATNYTITYNTNGGNSIAQKTYTIETATFNLPTPTRTGYTFAGWYGNANLTGNNVTQVAKGSTGNKTFYAAWTINQYTLTYSAGEGGSVTGTHESGAKYDYNTSIKLTAEPTAGNIFVQWVNANGTMVSTSNPYTFNLTENKTVKAEFAPPTTVYLKPEGYWPADKARFAIYTWGAGKTDRWVEMQHVDCENQYYSANIPTGYSDFKYVRLNPTGKGDASKNDGLHWDYKWNETGNLTVQEDLLYTTPRIYLKPNNNWTQANARFAAYFFEDGKEAQWMSMYKDGNYYYCDMVDSYSKVIFCRMDPANGTNDFANCWNKSADQTIAGNCFTINTNEWGCNGNGEGNDGKGAAGKWSEYYTTFTIPTYPLTLKATPYGEYTVKCNGVSHTSSRTKDIVIDLPVGATVEITKAESYDAAYNDSLVIKTSSNSQYEAAELNTTYTFCGATTIQENFTTETAHVVYLRVPNSKAAEWNPTGTSNYVYSVNNLNTLNEKTGTVIEMTSATDDEIYKETGYTYYKCSIKAGCHTFRFESKTEKNAGATKQTEYFEHLLPLGQSNCFTINNKNGTTFYGSWDLNSADGDFRVLYVEQQVAHGTDENAWKTVINTTYQHASDIIKKGNANDRNIVSLHVKRNKALNPEIVLQQMRDGVWVDIERRMVMGPLETNDASLAMLPGRRNAAGELTYDNGIEEIKQDDKEGRVWNFTVEQTGNLSVPARLLFDPVNALNGSNLEPYKGNYYIRTDNAAGGWMTYAIPGNVMTHSLYSLEHSGYSHYFCKWVDKKDQNDPEDKTYTPNTKFVVANEYGAAISDTIVADDYTDGNGTLEADANVRWMWNEYTNIGSRAYIAGSDVANFLTVHYASQSKKFNDQGEWIYAIDLTDVQVDDKLTSIKALYDGKEQELLEQTHVNAGGLVMLTSTGVARTGHHIRVIYDFKINQTLIYLIPTGADVSTSIDMIIERTNQDEEGKAIQVRSTITPADEGLTVYGVITLTKDHITDPKKSEQEALTYWISFPFDVKIGDITGFGEVGKHWMIKYYDGAERAEKGWFLDTKTFWKFFLDTENVMRANRGYVLTLNKSLLNASNPVYDNTETLRLYFPSMNKITTEINSGYRKDTVHITEHWCNITSPADRTIKDSHWNLIGVPSFANQTITTTNENVKYFYDYSHKDDKYNTAQNAGAKTFKPMHAYMVQFAGVIDWNSQAFDEAQKQLAAKKNADAEEQYTLRLELQQNGTKADQTFVELHDDATTMFDMNVDLTKMFNTGANIYTLIGSETEVAANVLPIANTVIPVGVQIAKAGEYTFAMPDGTDGITVELIDYETNTTTNLLLSEYNVSLPAGTFENRFALIVKPNKVATDMETIDDETNGVKKYIIDGKLFLQKDGMLYDAQGHIVR